MTRPRRQATLVAGLLLAAVPLSGCAVLSEQSTQMDYTPSDGSQQDVGALQVRNLMWLAQDATSPGTLVGWFGNSGQAALEVTVSAANGADVEFVVEPGASWALGPTEDDFSDEEVLVDEVGAVPGTLTPVTVSSQGQAVDIPTPVLAGILPEYVDLVPTAGPTG